MNMSACTLFNEQDKGSDLLCIGKTKCTSEKGLLRVISLPRQIYKRYQICLAVETRWSRYSVACCGVFVAVIPA